jgi:hypothetical protein
LFRLKAALVVPVWVLKNRHVSRQNRIEEILSRKREN